MSLTRRTAFLAVFLIFISFLFGGVIGFKKESDCSIHLDSPGELALCYNEVAVSYAFLQQDRSQAELFCDKILDVANIAGAVDKNILEAQANLCYRDIARILKDPTICNKINQNRFTELVAGADVTKELCMQEAQRSAVRPVCSTVLFILFLVGGSLFFRAAHKF